MRGPGLLWGDMQGLWLLTGQQLCSSSCGEREALNSPPTASSLTLLHPEKKKKNRRKINSWEEKVGVELAP